MMKEALSQIIKSDFRRHKITDFYNCFSSLNDAELNTDEYTFGSLLIFDEEIIAPKHTITYSSNQDEAIVLIPIVGVINLTHNPSESCVQTNQIEVFHIASKNSFSITNPDAENNNQFLHLRFKTDPFKNHKKEIEISKKNKIQTLLNQPQFSISIGIFEGRYEADYHLKNSKNGVFAFVLNGAFEFQNRLLENRDGLKIWNIDQVEMEALSHNAIVLIIEVTFD